jgi:hypothetical protein
MLGGVAALNATHALVTGGINGGPGYGAMIWDDQGAHAQTLVREKKLSMILGVALKDAKSGLVVGPALFGAPIGFLTDDGGQTWKPTEKTYLGTKGVVSGDDVHVMPGGSGYAYVAEFNAWANGTACTDGSPGVGEHSNQCSGVLAGDGSSFDFFDWGGTDGPGTDAMTGAFPSPSTWCARPGQRSPREGPAPPHAPRARAGT